MSTLAQRIVNAPSPLGEDGLRHFDAGLLPNRVSQAIWRGTEVGHATEAVVPTGFSALDAQLPGGGWPCNSLTELLQPQPSLCEWRLLSPALSKVASAGGPVLLVGPPKRPHTPGLSKLGISEKSLVWIAADTPADKGKSTGWRHLGMASSGSSGATSATASACSELRLPSVPVPS
jgi:protein ImuA